MTACQFPACSAFLARVATMAMTPMAARTPATTRRPTPTGLPQSAPSRSVLAATRTTMLTTPRRKLVKSFPPRIDARGIGAAKRRLRVPSLRSSSRLVTPNCTVKKRKKTAIPAA